MVSRLLFQAMSTQITQVTEEIVENLDPYDFDEAICLLESLAQDTEGVEDVGEAQRRLRIYLAQQVQQWWKSI